MSGIGFREAYAHSPKVRPASDAVVMVVSLAGFVLLKIIAWHDRHFERDAQDLGFVMQRYPDAGNQDRLFTEHSDLLGEDFDYELASACVLGRDLAARLTAESRLVVEQVLTEETNEEGHLAMIAAMVRNNAYFRSA